MCSAVKDGCMLMKIERFFIMHKCRPTAGEDVIIQILRSLTWTFQLECLILALRSYAIICSTLAPDGLCIIEIVVYIVTLNVWSNA